MLACALALGGICVVWTLSRPSSSERLQRAAMGDQLAATSGGWLRDDDNHAGSGFYDRAAPLTRGGKDAEAHEASLREAQHRSVDAFLERLYNSTTSRTATRQTTPADGNVTGSGDAGAAAASSAAVKAQPSRAADPNEVAQNIATFDAAMVSDPVLKTCGALLDKLALDLADAESARTLLLRLMPDFHLNRLPRSSLQLGRCDLTLELQGGNLLKSQRDGSASSAAELESLPPLQAASLARLAAWLKVLQSRLPGARLPNMTFNLDVVQPEEDGQGSACDDDENEFGHRRPPHRFGAVNCYPRCEGATLLPIDAHSTFADMLQLGSAFARTRPWKDGSEKTAWFIWQGSDGASIRVADFAEPKNWGGSAALEVGNMDRLIFTGFASLNISRGNWPTAVAKSNFLIALPTISAEPGTQYNPAVKNALLSGAVLLRQWDASVVQPETEWYDIFLRPGKHFVAFDASKDGFDGIKTALFSAWNPRRSEEMEMIAKRGREAALRLFDTKTVSCYTYYALHLYAAYQRGER